MALSLLVPVVAAACGDDGEGGGAAVDAGDTADASDPADAGPTTTSCGVQIDARAAERAGVAVLFSGADGSVIGTEFTDVDGLASRDDCESDTTLTVVRAYPKGPRGLYSVMGVQPGDTVVLGSLLTTPVEIVNVDINVVTSGDVGGLVNVSSYGVLFGLGEVDVEPGVPEIAQIPRRSVGQDGLLHAVGVARDGSGRVVGYSTGSVDPGGAEPIPLALGPWVSVTPSPVDVDFGEIPGGFQAAGVALEQRIAGRRYFASEPDGLPAGSAQLSKGLPPGIVDTHEIHIGFTTDNGFFDSQAASQIGTHVGVEPAQSHTFDRASVLLPRLYEPAVLRSGDRLTIQWFTDGDVSESDGAGFILEFADGEGTRNWFVVTPYAGTGMLTSPVLPDELQSFAPSPEVSIDVERGLVYDLDYASYRDLITEDADNLFQDGLGGTVPGLIRPNVDRFMIRYTRWTSGCSTAVPGAGGLVGGALVLALAVLFRRRRRGQL